MSSTTSGETRGAGGFVGWEFRRHSKRKPSLCQRSTVSGFTSSIFSALLLLATRLARWEQPEPEELDVEQVYLMQQYLTAADARERGRELASVAALSREQLASEQRRCEDECLLPPSLLSNREEARLKYQSWQRERGGASCDSPLSPVAPSRQGRPAVTRSVARQRSKATAPGRRAGHDAGARAALSSTFVHGD